MFQTSFCCKSAGTEGRSIKVVTHFFCCHLSSATAEVVYVSRGDLSIVLRDNMYIWQKYLPAQVVTQIFALLKK